MSFDSSKNFRTLSPVEEESLVGQCKLVLQFLAIDHLS